MSVQTSAIIADVEHKTLLKISSVILNDLQSVKDYRVEATFKSAGSFLVG